MESIAMTNEVVILRSSAKLKQMQKEGHTVIPLNKS